MNFEVQVQESAGCAKFQEICVWLYSLSMAYPPEIGFNDDSTAVLIKYQSNQFYDKKLMFGNPKFHGKRKQIMKDLYKSKIRMVTRNLTRFPIYIVQCPLSMPGLEIVFSGLNFKEHHFDHNGQTLTDLICVVRIFVRLRWQDVLRITDTVNANYKCKSDNSNSSDGSDADRECHHPRHSNNHRGSTNHQGRNSAGHDGHGGMMPLSSNSGNKRQQTRSSKSYSISHETPTKP